MPEIDPATQARLNASAARALGLDDVHVDTAPMRSLTHDDVAAHIVAVETTGNPVTWSGYWVDEAGFAEPATFTLQPNDVSPVHPVVDDTRRSGRGPVKDRSVVLGKVATIGVATTTGRSHQVPAFDSVEAAEANPGRRSGIGPARLADPDGDLVPLMPMYGAQASVSILVADTDADELKARITRALEAEFGDDLNAYRKVQTRLVANRRVDLYRAGQVVAVDVLAAATPMVMATHGQGLESRTHVPDLPVIVGS